MVEGGSYSFLYKGSDLKVWKKYVEDDLNIIFTRFEREANKQKQLIDMLEDRIVQLEEKMKLTMINTSILFDLIDRYANEITKQT